MTDGSKSSASSLKSSRVQTMPAVTPIIELLEQHQIPVFKPGRPEYNRAIATANLLFRFSRADFIVRPLNAEHVQTVIKLARQYKVMITIKCNGNSYAGHSTALKGGSLDLRDMKKVRLEINSNSQTITIDAGCQWGHVYQELINGKHDGYIINGGQCPTVGVSGFILGGGLGPFTRSFGMGSDALTEATLVTADRKLVTVRETDRPDSNEGRLFWALRGAGGGNFGVLVQMKLKVQKLRSEYVVAGRYQWFPKDGFTYDVISTMNHFYTAKWPNEMTIDSTWICDLRQTNRGGIWFTLAFNGRKREYDDVIDRYNRIEAPNRTRNLKTGLPKADPVNEALKTQFKRRVLEEKSTRFLHETLVFQWMGETERAYPTNKTFELFTSFVFKNDEETIERITARIRRLMEEFRMGFTGEQVSFLVTWIHSGGKAAEVKPTASAFFWREAVFHTYITVEWVDKWMEKDMREFLKMTKAELRPLSLEKKAAFINFPDRDSLKQSYEDKYFGDNHKELRQVKGIWDKDNFFNWEQGVQLPSASRGPEDKEEDTDKTDQLAREQWETWKYVPVAEL